MRASGSSGAGGAITFSTPQVVDAGQRCERRIPVGSTHFAQEVAPGSQGPDIVCRQAGAQTKPALAYAAGKLLLVYKEARVNDPGGDGPLDVNGFPSGRARRHDLRAAEIDVATGAVKSSQVSLYSVRADGSTLNPGFRDESRDALTMYQSGEVPFAGDYEAVVASGGAASGPSPTFFAAWYDTRKVQFPPGGIDGDWLRYTPPGAEASGCAAGTRDADVFTAEIGPMLAGAPQTFKQLGAPVGQVTYAVYVRNRTSERKFYSLQLKAPEGVSASFDQFDPTVTTLGTSNVAPGERCASSYPACTEYIPVEPYSTGVRTVFATASQVGGPTGIQVLVDDPATTVAPDQIVRLNPDPNNAPLSDGTTRFEEKHQPQLSSPTFNPGTVNPGTVNPGTLNPGTLNPGTLNPGTVNPGVINGGFTEYTDLNFTVENTGNTTSGYNTFLNLADEGLLENHLFQVIVSKVQSTPVLSGCGSSDQPRDDLVVNFASTPGTLNPGTVNPGTVNPGTLNPGTLNPGTLNSPTFSLAPSAAVGGSHDGTRHSPALADRAVVTVRVWHCRVEGSCGAHVHAESPANERLPGNEAALADVLSLAVVAQAYDVSNGVVGNAPSYAVFGRALDPTRLHFVREPVDVESGQRVEVTVGSPLPGIGVTLGRSSDFGATSEPIATATADAQGLARFSVLPADGDDLVLTASAGDAAATSRRFSVGAISFETYPDGSATCDDSCDVEDEYRSRGVRITFTRKTSLEQTVETSAFLLDSTVKIDEGGATRNHSVTAPDVLGETTVGILNLCFAETCSETALPQTVRFRLRGPGVADGSVTVTGSTGSGAVTADAERGSFRTANNETRPEITYTLTSPAGIRNVQIVLEIDGKVYLDNLRLIR